MNASMTSAPKVPARGHGEASDKPASPESLIPPIPSLPSGGMTGGGATASGMTGGISHRDLGKPDGKVKISGGVG